MINYFEGVDAAWIWLAIGLALGALELLVPGVYLIWLALAAVLTGFLTYVMDFGVMTSVINFVVLSLIAVYSAKRFLRSRPIESADPLMNKRGGRLVGELVTVVGAIKGGEGRVKVGDSEWIARGPDAKAGTQMRVAATNGAILSVVPLDAEQAEPAMQEAPPAEG